MLTTTRYGFPQINPAAGGDNVDVANDFNAPWAKLDTLLGTQVCSSTTRPAAPVQGQLIYETDTGFTRKYTGTAWQTVGNAVGTSGARPANPIQGDELYETDTGAQRVYTGAAWGGIIPTATSTALPANPIRGDMAYLSDLVSVVYYSGTAWHISNAVVCTAATRPTGASLQTGTVIYETDTKRCLVYNGASWDNKAYANFITTSTTHPSSPFQGLEIYETDTTMSAVYSGSSYQYGIQQVAPTQSVSSAASITFSSIPAVKRLLVLWRFRLATATTGDLEMQLDRDTAAHYNWAKTQARGALVSATDGGGSVTFAKIGVVSGDTANYSGNGALWIDGWNLSTTFPTFIGTSSNWDTSTSYWCETYSGIYGVVGPHTSLKIMPSTSTFTGEVSLYGVM